jgi:uncharacterized protein YndB with AHSA1/START domain
VTDATRTLVAETDRAITLERVIDAPRALVFKAFTDPAHLPHWFGPGGFTCTTRTIDVREGGCWDFIMHGPDGTDWANFHRYLEVAAPERLVYDVGETADGPAQFRATVTFEDLGVRTRVRMTNAFPTQEACEAVKGFGAVELGAQTLGKLADRVAGMGLRISRTVDAPRELVYQAWTDPERLAKWWGPVGMTIEVQQADIRPGGVFHYRMADGQGAEMWGKFSYLELQAPERIVWLNAFSNARGETTRAPFAEGFPLEIYNVVTLTEQDGKTLLELGGGPLTADEAESALYASMAESMQKGFGGTFDQLDAYLAGSR